VARPVLAGTLRGGVAGQVAGSVPVKKPTLLQGAPMRCAKHPNEETFVRCGRCGVPVCGRCSVMAPTGIRCRDCAQLRWSPVYRVAPRDAAFATAAGAGVALAMGWLAAINLLVLLGGVIYGYAVGEAVHRASGRRRGSAVEVIAGLCALAGPLFWLLAPVPFEARARTAVEVILAGRIAERYVSALLILALNLVLAVVVAVSRQRSH